MRRKPFFVLLAGFVVLACWFTGRSTTVTNDCSVKDATVYAGQRFLAQRIEIDNTADSTEFGVQMVWIQNAGTRADYLPWDYVERVEIVESLTGKVLRSAVPNATGFAELLIDNIPYKVPAHGKGKIELWLTLKDSVPGGLKFQARCRVGGVSGRIDVDYTECPAAVFTIGTPEGLEKILSSNLPDQAVFGGQRFLAQELTLQDSDADPYAVNVGSLVVKNDPRSDPLGDSFFAKIEVCRASDGAVLGQTSTLLGVNSSGVRIPLTGLTVSDDGSVGVQVWVTLKKQVPPERKIRLGVEVWHSEGVESFFKDAPEGPVFTTKEPGGLEATDVTGRGDSVFGGATVMVQRFKLQHKYPNDPNDVVVTGFKVRNAASDPQLSSSYVDSIEIRTEEGTSVAKTTSVGGFTGGGVFLPANFTVKPGSPVVLEVWLSLKESTPEGKKIQIKTTISQRVGTKSLNDVTVSTQATFVTAVDHPPQVSFSWSPEKPKWNDEIEFEPSWSDPQDPEGRDPIVYSRWDFGDGKTVEQDGPPEEVTHCYGTGGEFTVTLLVRDDKGIEATASKTVTVTNEKPTNVDFSWDPRSPKWSDQITFTPARDIEDPDGRIAEATFTWDFGDGTMTETTGSKAVKHTYGKGGKFKVKLTVTDAGGASASKEHEIEVSNELPTGVDFEISPAEPKWNQEITFTPVRGVDDPDGDISKATFTWIFGDGNTKTVVGPQSVKHTYNKGGEFTVRLTVTDQGGASAYKEKKIKVSWPAVDFTWDPSQPLVGEKVTFTASPAPDSYGFGYRWDFGDGTVWPPEDNPPATTNVATHTYEKKGTYTVKLVVTYGTEIVGRKERDVSVGVPVNHPPTVSTLTLNPEEPEAGQTVTFRATASDPEGDEIIAWQWDFDGDGAVDSTQAPPVTYTYERDGIYTVKVRAKDAGSESWGEWYQKTIYVRPKGGPEVGLYVLRNPARTQATLRIFLPQGATNAVLYIYDLLGHLILQREVSGGEFRWGLTDENDVLVPSGLYFALVVAEKDGKPIRSRIGRILVIRQGG